MQNRLKSTLAGRSAPIDIMRAASVLFIVGYWHLFQYAQVIPWYRNPVTYRLVVTVLGLFVFISGYLIGAKDIDLTKGKILSFYKNRFWRIYPPFLLSGILFLLLGIDNSTIFLKTMTLAAMFVPPAALTLWFVCMLVLYYLIAPLLIALRKKSMAYLGLCLFIGTALFLYGRTNMLDIRLLLYFPCFAAGIYLARRTLPASPLMYVGLVCITGLSLALTALHPSPLMEYTAWSTPWALCSALAVFCLITHCGQKLKNYPVIAAISEASFFMYLFHRPVYEVMKRLWFPASPDGQVGYLLCICLPLLVIVSLIGQRLYNALIERAVPRRFQT